MGAAKTIRLKRLINASVIGIGAETSASSQSIDVDLLLAATGAPVRIIQAWMMGTNAFAAMTSLERIASLTLGRQSNTVTIVISTLLAGASTRTVSIVEVPTIPTKV